MSINHFWSFVQCLFDMWKLKFLQWIATVICYVKPQIDHSKFRDPLLQFKADHLILRYCSILLHSQMHSYTTILTQAPKNYSHTFWRVAPKIISILFGGGRNLKNKKTWKNQGKHTHKKKNIFPDSFGKGGSGQESLNIVYFLKEEGRIFYFLEEVALFVYSFSKEGVSPKEYNNIASVSRNLAQRAWFLRVQLLLEEYLFKIMLDFLHYFCSNDHSMESYCTFLQQHHPLWKGLPYIHTYIHIYIYISIYMSKSSL